MEVPGNWCKNVFFLFKCCFICLYTDVDECSLNTHDCDSRSERRTCTNTQGSFTCGCQSGYKIAADKKTCNGWNFSLFFVWIKEVYYYIVLWTWTNINRTNIHRYNFCLAILMNVLWLKPVMLCICGFFFFRYRRMCPRGTRVCPGVSE